MLNSLLRGLLGTEDPPTKVLEVKSDNYVSRLVCIREDAIILYGPKMDSRNARDKCYEVVLHRAFNDSLYQAFSLFRSEQRAEAEKQFSCFKDKISLYLEVTKECSIGSLQKLCDILSKHPSWTVAHIAAYFGLVELFNNPSVQILLNDVEIVRGTTPVMVAVKTGNVRTVQSLISFKCTLEQLDFNANSIFHYASSSSKEIISALASDENCKRVLNCYNRNGHTPLHMACLADKPECVKALLLAGANVNLPATPIPVIPSALTTPGYVGDLLQENVNKLFAEDMKLGGTPLHWCISRQVIETLVDMNCDIDALNFEGRTAVHIMVIRQRLECVVALLSRGANPSIGDYQGNTPLHFAVKDSNVAVVQALIVFGADINYRNNTGITPRHCVPSETSSNNADKILYIIHAVGAERCSRDVQSCLPSCAADGTYDGVPPPTVPGRTCKENLIEMLSVGGIETAASTNESRSGRLLCLDGGGIRGLVLVQILIELEEAIGKPIMHSFDWIAGTSTGGILALALACGKTLKECQCLYFRMKEFAFAGKRPYPSEPLETILKECLGTDTKMGDIENPKLMVMGAIADRKPIDLYLFRNYESPEEILQKLSGDHNTNSDSELVPPRDQLVWATARASGAAPSYFRPFGRFLDGGLVANNPTLDALTELAELRLALRAAGRHRDSLIATPGIVVSCGTGLVPVTKLQEIDVFRPESLFDTARLAMGLSAIGTLLVDQATQADGRVVDRARAWCSTTGVPYYRFCPQLSRDITMDERGDDRLVGMLWETAAYMRANRDKVIKVANMIKQFD